MTSPNRFRLVTEEPDDAATVHLIEVDGKTLGEASWPVIAIGGRIEGPALGNPVAPPLAFNNAIAAMERYGLSSVAVMMGEGAVWDPAWGTLDKN